MIKKRTIILGLAALLMLNCQQPTAKEKGAATKTGYSKRAGINTKSKRMTVEIDQSIVTTLKDDPIINIPDKVFLDSLVELGVDTNGDGKISQSEALRITGMRIIGLDGLVSLEGLQAFKNVTYIDIIKETTLENVPLDLPLLISFSLLTTNVKTLNFENVPKLNNLTLVGNSQMGDLDFSPLKNTLTSFDMYDAPGVTQLNFKDFTYLNVLIVYNMDSLLTFEVPTHYENKTMPSQLYFITSPLVKTFDMHLMPNDMHSVDITGNSSLTKVYVNAEQYKEFTTNTAWNTDHPEFLEVVS